MEGLDMPWVDAYDDTQNPIQIFVPDKDDDSQELWLQSGQSLYYMDRNTREVKSGKIGKIGNRMFTLPSRMAPPSSRNPSSASACS